MQHGLGIEKILSKIPTIQNKRIYVFGTGNTATLYQQAFVRSPELKIEGYVNSNPSDKMFCGKPVYRLSDMAKIKNACILLCSTQPSIYSEIGKKLDDMGLEWHHIDELFFGMHREEIAEVYHSLNDDVSKNTYCQLLQCRMSCKYPPADIISPSQYFVLPQFQVTDETAVFVDCGAYTGDTIEDYIGTHNGCFGKIIAFEPDNINFMSMRERVSGLQKEWKISSEKIQFYPYAIGDECVVQTLERYEENDGLGSKLVTTDFSRGNTCQCRVVAIDNILTDRVTMLKADIESYEYKMLRGAEKSIKKYQPNLAVCIYHNAVDFYSIPLLIKQINPRYKLAIRHHSAKLDDTVLYAWV